MVAYCSADGTVLRFQVSVTCHSFYRILVKCFCLTVFIANLISIPDGNFNSIHSSIKFYFFLFFFEQIKFGFCLHLSMKVLGPKLWLLLQKHLNCETPNIIVIAEQAIKLDGLFYVCFLECFRQAFCLLLGNSVDYPLFCLRCIYFF